MTPDESIKRIEKYIKGNDTRPRFVNVQNAEALSKLKMHFNVGSNIFMSVSKSEFSAEDELPNFDTLLDSISQQDAPIFLEGFTTGAKLWGQKKLKQLISELAHYSKENCRTVVICYQCKDELTFSDIRLQDLVYFVYDKEPDERPQIILIPENMPAPPNANPIEGVNNIATEIEKGHGGPLYVRTKKSKASFASSMLSIVELNDAYDILCLKDQCTRILRKDYGTSQQWSEALNKVSKKGSWAQLLNEKICNTEHLEHAIGNWSTMSDSKQWYYFIALKLFGAKNNQCLHMAAKKADAPNQLKKESYRCLLGLANTDRNFWTLYEQRKMLLKLLGESEEEAAEYCELAKAKGADTVYYLTDGSRVEKEHIIRYLDKYGQELEKEKVLGVLKKVYPDLYSYLKPFRFQDDLLSKYFQTYTYAKAINKVLPELVDIMEEQAVKREYNSLLKPRSELMADVPQKDVTLYFVDAMGAEFISFINEKCYQMKLRPTIEVARCNLPSTTSFNKDFLEGFDEEDIVIVKEIDDIKHKGEENYDYSKTKQPLHLIRELEIIEELLKKAKQRLQLNPEHQVFFVADHGATRMAVIMEKTLSIDVDSKGTYSGRVCEYTKEVAKIKEATEADDGYYVLANYDRFKGGRRASVEAHGGATLEEVTVPVIKLALVPQELEIVINTPVIKVSSRTKAEISFYSTLPLKDVSISVNGNLYDAQTDDQRHFKAIMPKIRRAVTYNADIYSENVLVWRGLEFKVESEGFKVNDLL
ncbi:MAG: BREX-4 system phosphatase PglZ [Acutalibacteraceae bacterium]|jgi:hypothetical protein